MQGNLPEVDNAHENESQYYVSNVAEDMAIVSYGPIGILTEVVVIAGVKVP